MNGLRTGKKTVLGQQIKNLSKILSFGKSISRLHKIIKSMPLGSKGITDMMKMKSVIR